VQRKSQKNEAAVSKTVRATSTALSSAKYAKVLGKAFGGLSTLITGIEGAFDEDGFTKGDAGKVVYGIVATCTGWVLGVIDLGTLVTTGDSFSDRLGSGIDNIK
jgi:hypothetical protein